MKTNHNILVGGGDSDRFIYNNKIVKDNLYFYKPNVEGKGSGINLKFKFKVEGIIDKGERSELELSIPELDEKTLEQIKSL